MHKWISVNLHTGVFEAFLSRQFHVSRLFFCCCFMTVFVLCCSCFGLHPALRADLIWVWAAMFATYAWRGVHAAACFANLPACCYWVHFHLPFAYTSLSSPPLFSYTSFSLTYWHFHNDVTTSIFSFSFSHTVGAGEYRYCTVEVHVLVSLILHWLCPIFLFYFFLHQAFCRHFKHTQRSDDFFISISFGSCCIHAHRHTNSYFGTYFFFISISTTFTLLLLLLTTS